MTEIPWQYQRDNLCFILLPAGEKGPKTPGWNLVSNGKRWDDPILIAHLERDKNYGCYPAPGSSLLNIDVDDADAFHKAGGAELVGETYRYSAWPDRQKYRAVVECPGMPSLWMGHKSEIKAHGSDKAALELFFPAGPITIQKKGSDGITRVVTEIKTGGQVVGLGSIHPDTKMPDAAFDENAEILTIEWDDLLAVYERIRPAAVEPQESGFTRVHGNYQTAPGQRLLRDRYRLSLEMPDNPYQTSSGEIRGSNPWHGSTSKGGNIAINLQKGVMYCFLCRKGYDAAGVNAIRRGIINCGDEYTAEVFRSHVAELERDFPQVRSKEIALYAARKAAERETKQPKVTISGIMGSSRWKKR